MTYIDNDRWGAAFDLVENARYEYRIEAVPDPFESWRDEIAKKTEAALDVTSELIEGRALVEQALNRASAADQAILRRERDISERAVNQADAVATLLGVELASVMRRNRSRAAAATSIDAGCDG